MTSLNYNHFSLLALVVFCFFSITSSAQDASISDIDERILAIEDLEPDNPYKAKKKELVSPYRFHKRMHQKYSGFAIEIATSFRPLERDFHVFKNFGNVHYLKRKDGHYSYMILLDFTKEKSVKEYYENIVLPKCPTAKAYKFKFGEAKLVK